MANRPGPIFVSRTNGLHQPESHAPADAARVAALVDELRRGLAHRGATGIRDLGRTFKIVDRDGSGSLDTEEFTRAVRMCKLQIEPEEVKLIFDHFDTRRDGRVDFEEFLRAVRGTMAPVRRSLVVQVFHALDSMGDGNGVLDVNDFTNIFDARSAPEVQAGRRSEADVLREFVEGFEGTRGNRDGTVTMVCAPCTPCQPRRASACLRARSRGPHTARLGARPARTSGSRTTTRSPRRSTTTTTLARWSSARGRASRRSTRAGAR